MDDLKDFGLKLLFGQQDQDVADEEVKREPVVPVQHLFPAGFTQVADGIYRSTFPTVLHLDIFTELKIQTICSLTGTNYQNPVKYWVARNAIQNMNVPVIANNAVGVKTSYGTIEHLFRRLIDPMVHPVVIHCDDGARQAACVVGCFRRLQGWPIGCILKEYREYPGSGRGLFGTLDVQFILNYHPSADLVRLAYVLGFTEETSALDCLIREGFLFEAQ